MVTGAIFWCSFWAASVAAITWVYSPGGLADPNRDLKEPGRRTPRAVCAEPCDDADPEPSPTATQPTTSTAHKNRSRRSTTPVESPTLPVPTPTLPVHVPPLAIRIEVSELWQLAGNRYATYAVFFESQADLTGVVVSTHIPSGTYFAECREQAGERICIDRTTGSDYDHGLTWNFDSVNKNRTYSQSFYVRLDSEMPTGQEIRNHAHAEWQNRRVDSVVEIFKAPAAMLLG